MGCEELYTDQIPCDALLLAFRYSSLIYFSGGCRVCSILSLYGQCLRIMYLYFIGIFDSFLVSIISQNPTVL